MTQTYAAVKSVDPVTHHSFHGVQVLRAVAAIMVVAYHAASNLSAGRGGQNYASLPGLEWGNAGVDLFFVISGFVITWTTRNRWAEPHATRAFLVKRAERILPLYWVLTTAKVLIVLALPMLFRATHLQPWHTVASYLLIPALDSEGRVNPVITAGWTLCFEVTFYYLFAISLAMRRRPIVVLTPVLIVFGVLGMVRQPSWGTPATLIDPMLLEFLAGMWIAELTRQGRVRGKPPLLVALLVACVSAWLVSDLLPSTDAHAWRALVWGAPSAVVLYAVVALERYFVPGRFWLPILLGEASYSIYLTHVLVLAPIIQGFHMFVLPTFGQWAVWSSTVILCIIAGLLVWRLVERRLVSIVKSLSTPTPSAATHRH